MFNNLASYLLGLTSQEPASVEPARRTDVRLTAVVDDDWVLVDRDSEGDTDVASSLESIPEAHECETQALYQTATTLLTRTSSTSSLPCTNIEESWFLTPPPCFTSAGPIHMETSPLENLLIEHPSMSVYQHSSQSALSVAVAAARRHSSAPSSPSAASSVLDDYDDEEMYSEAIAERLADRGATVAVPQPRPVSVNSIKQQERQCIKIKNAQKLQIQKACQSLKRGYIERNNKAREVNCRNHRQRRGERSQGSARSNANNNRKC
ncbi:Diabetes and obesity regulated [Carabus blaptoides fortunei]